jgi:SAM-dependent methyltransferase
VSELAYQGTELGLFAHAKNWKAYYSGLLAPWIKGRVLEVGAGIGGTMPSLWNKTVSQWVCLEPDPELGTELRKRIKEFGRDNVEARIGTIDDLAPDEYFDCILYIDVLEHIRDDRDELIRASARLARGGSLVVLSPAFQILFSPFVAALGHERRYTARTLAEVFPDGLVKRKVFYADSVGAALSLSNRMLLRKSMPTLSQIQFWDRRVIPISRFLDRVAGRLFGRSVIAVYERPQ